MAKQGILALFKDANSAGEASRLLTQGGFDRGDIEVMSGAPYPDGAFGEEPAKHRLYVFPLMGAIMGFSVAVLLTIGTQLSFPLVTGGKPILSVPPMIIVTYEGTMLGAIIFTVLGIIFESRLPRAILGLYDKRITEGYIGLLLACPEERVSWVDTLLHQAGAEEIKHQEPRAR